MALEIDSSASPFTHYVIDNFVTEEMGHKLSSQFPDYNSPSWFEYSNPLERKRTIRDWGMFPPETYQLFGYLCGAQLDLIKELTGCYDLYSDHGLHGAGWHIHKRGDHLNVHLDYSIHPYAKLQRKYNLIIYLTPDWDPSWGGGLELWSHNQQLNLPSIKVKTIDCKFRRAVLFDTTQNSWHGVSEPINCPEGVYRKSAAMYYLTTPEKDTDQRNRALYAPREDQKNNADIIDLINKRKS